MDHLSRTKRPRPHTNPDEGSRKRLKTANDPVDIHDSNRNRQIRGWSPQIVNPLHLAQLSWLDLAIPPQLATTSSDRYSRREAQLAAHSLTTPRPRDDSIVGSNITEDPISILNVLHGEFSKFASTSQLALKRQIRAAETLMRERIRIQRLAVANDLKPPIRVGSHILGSSNRGRLEVKVRRFGRAEDPKTVLHRLFYGTGT